jgi:hypothetical protein
MESSTLPLEQWELVRDVILEVIDDADPHAGVLLKTFVATVQARLGGHPAFPGGRLTNFTRTSRWTSAAGHSSRLCRVHRLNAYGAGPEPPASPGLQVSKADR